MDIVWPSNPKMTVCRQSVLEETDDLDEDEVDDVEVDVKSTTC